MLGAEKQPGKNVAPAAHADDGDVGRRLHQIGGIDDVILQVGELADVAIVPGDDRGGVRIDIEDGSGLFWSLGVWAKPQPNGAVLPSAVTLMRE